MRSNVEIQLCKFFALFALLSLLGTAVAEPSVPKPDQPHTEEVILSNGQVQWVDLEGGYFRLVEQHGGTYLPTNFEQYPHLHKDRLAVVGVLRIIPQRFSFQMGGDTPVQIVELEAVAGEPQG
jgi:hypothetical protein